MARAKPIRVQLTEAVIRDHTCPADKQQIILRDTGQPGLGLRITAGSKSYIFQGKLAGKTIRITIGSPDDWTTDGARRYARELKVLIDRGLDPRQVIKEAQEAEAAKRKKQKVALTPALDAWRDYIDSRTPRWSARHRADHETMAREGGEIITRGRRAGASNRKQPGILRPLLVKPLVKIDCDLVAVWAARESAKRPTRTRLAISLLNAFLNWCADNPKYRDLVDAGACKRIKKDLPKPGARDDCLQREQLALWFDAVRKIRNPAISAYLQILLLTGARRNELAPLRWDDVDMRWDSLTIRDKVEGDRTIPLTPYVKSLLTGLKKSNVISLANKAPKQSPFVFASPRSKSGHITEPRIAHNKALEMAGLPPLTLHGLRRSFGTLAEWVECPAGVTAQIMGHKPSAIAEKHYRRRPLDLLRMWHVKIERWILDQADTTHSHPVKAFNKLVG